MSYRCVTSVVGRALVGFWGQVIRARWGIRIIRIWLWLCGAVRLLLVLVLVWILPLVSLLLRRVIANPARGGRGVRSVRIVRIGHGDEA